MWIFYIDVEFTVTCDSQLITCLPSRLPHSSRVQHVSPPICASSSCLFCLRWKHFFISLYFSLAFCPVSHACWFWHEFITVPWASGFHVLVAFGNQSKYQSQASPDRMETKSQGSREKIMWPGKRMKKFPITVSSKILPLWGDPLGNTHTHTPRVFSIVL